MAEKRFLNYEGLLNFTRQIASKFVKAADFLAHKGDTTAHTTSTDKSHLNTAYQHSQAKHAPADAQKNTITGVKGNAETSYRIGNVNLTPANIGAAPTTHNHTKSQITDMPTTLPNPASLKVQLNGGTAEGTNQFTYTGSAAKSVNITPGGIGAATSGHGHSAATSSAAGYMSAADKAKLDGIASGANKYTLPTAGQNTLGGVKTTSTVTSSSGYTAAPIISGVVYYKDTNTTYNNMKGATADAAGSAGLVPAPAAGKQGTYLRADGVWATPANTTYGTGNATTAGITKLYTGTGSATDGSMTQQAITNALNGKAASGHGHSSASSSAAGFMSATDKAKLDGIASGANKYTLPTAGKDALGGVKTTSTVTSNSGYTACPIIGGVPYYKDTNTTYTLSSFGITATAAELNYMDGVTSNVQTQLNGKASSGHTHNYAGSSSAGGAANSVKSALTLQFNGSTKATFNGSSAATVNITPSAIGAAASSHGRHVPTSCDTITDWNSATSTGWYMASGAKNAPTSGTTWYFGYVIAHNSSYVIQEAYQFTASTDAKAIPKYIRAKMNGTWGAWTNVTVAKAVPSDAKFTDNNTTYGLASTSANGLLRKLTGSTSQYMRADGTWATPPNTTYSVATTSANGLMSSSDKSKLDGIASGANKYTLPTASKSTLGGVKTTSTVTSSSGYTACPIISGVPYYKDTNTTYSLSSFGITASAKEINCIKGATSSIQSQINSLNSTLTDLKSFRVFVSMFSAGSQLNTDYNIPIPDEVKGNGYMLVTLMVSNNPDGGLVPMESFYDINYVGILKTNGVYQITNVACLNNTARAIWVYW